MLTQSNLLTFSPNMSNAYSYMPLIESSSQSVVIIGAGFSIKDLPGTQNLTDTLRKIAADLGAGIDPDADDFYSVADSILAKLATEGRGNNESRLWLAEKLGILDAEWFIPPNGNTPKHRALARLVMDQCLSAIITTNWDTHIEMALESFGLGEKTQSRSPWSLTKYARTVNDTHIPALAEANVFPIFKPHGCVKELKKASRTIKSGHTCPAVTFRVSKSDLASTIEPSEIDKAVATRIAQYPLVAIGWKATEDYLRETIMRAASNVQKGQNDFSLIARTWYPPDEQNPTPTNHDDIASAYQTNRDHSWFRVEQEGWPGMDGFFQWLQTQYALERLVDAAATSEAKTIQKLLTEIRSACAERPIFEWVDFWLPAWVRMCWRTGVMRGVDPRSNKAIEPSDLPLTSRDAHVPLRGMTIERLDLVAAAELLVAIHRDLDRYDFQTFPGALWERSKERLLLPLPGWEAQNPRSDLNGLKPLIERFPLQLSKEICLVLLHTVGQSGEAVVATKTKLEAFVRSLMTFSALAQPGALGWVDVGTLKGD